MNSISVERSKLKTDELVKCKIYKIAFGEYPLKLKVKLQLEKAGIFNSNFTISSNSNRYIFELQVLQDKIQISKEGEKYLIRHLFYLYSMKASRIFYKGIAKTNKKRVLAKNLKWLRESNGYSLEKGAELINIAPQTLENIEKVRLPMKEVKKELNFDLINKIYSVQRIEIFNYLWFLKKVNFLCVKDILEKER